MSGDTVTSTESLSSNESSKSAPTKYVKLNVGGSLFYTTLGTLTKRYDSMLRAMFSGRMEVLTDSEGMCSQEKIKFFAPFLFFTTQRSTPKSKFDGIICKGLCLKHCITKLSKSTIDLV